jgi:signal transduction histidine kinase/ligand-binding sensor domain-containing protein
MQRFAVPSSWGTRVGSCRPQTLLGTVCLFFCAALWPVAALPAAPPVNTPAAQGSRADLRFSAPQDLLRDLRHTLFRPEDGAPNSIRDMAQTADGLLWLATSKGLYRYDGARFDSELGGRLPSPYAYALLAEPDGSLWIGYAFGGVSRLRGQRLYNFDKRELPRGSVLQFFRSSDRVLWVSTSTGLARLNGAHWQTVTLKDGYSGDPPEWMGLCQGRFVVMTPYDAFLYDPGTARFERRPRNEGVAARYGIPAGSRWRPDLSHTSPGIAPHRSLIDRSGSLWLSGFRVLIRYSWPDGATSRPAEDRFTSAMGLGGDIRCVLEDREGNIWVGTDNGLERFSAPTFHPHRLPDGMESNPLLIPGEHGEVWVGRTRAPIVRLGPRPRDIPELGKGVSTAARASDAALWVAGSGGIFEYRQGRVLKKLPPPPLTEAQLRQAAAEESTYQAIAVDASGAVWLSVARADLFRWDGIRWSLPQKLFQLPDGPAIRLLEDARQRLWIAYPDNQLALVEGGRTRLFSAADGLTVGNVLVVDVEAEHVWIGGDRGLALWAGGRFKRVIGRGGVDFRIISGIAQTAAGELWLNAGEGVYRIPAASLHSVLSGASSPVDFELFDWRDGLTSVARPIRPAPTLLNGPDGQIWFARFEGLWSIDPAHIRRNPVAPRIMIEDLVVNDVQYSAPGPLILPEGSRNLRIDYTAASLTDPQRTGFRYRLLGVDEGWQDPGTRRQAYYTNLGPGHYEFRVTAENKDGVWSRHCAVLRFTIARAWYQTLSFRVSMAVLAAVLLLFLFFIRLEQIQRQYRRITDARRSERERIARDVHDTLLQGVQALLFRVQLWEDDPLVPESLRQEMSRVIGQSRSMVIEGRDRILMLRRDNALPVDFVEALVALGNEAGSGSSARYELTVTGEPRSLTGNAQEQLLDIVREAVRNAFQHAGARRILVSVAYRRSDLLLCVADDGRGISPDILNGKKLSDHFGLLGMRERARHLDGRLRIDSRPGAGTRIEVRLPAGIAFHDAFRWPWQRKTLQRLRRESLQPHKPPVPCAGG